MTQDLRKYGRIGVVMGGTSSERDVSVKSGQAVLNALLESSWDAVGILLEVGEPEKIRKTLVEANLKLVFLALHGKLGEDGTIQFICESIPLPYTGSGIRASALAFDKTLAQTMFKDHQINVAPFKILNKKDKLDLSVVEQEMAAWPLVVKPAREGSSIGVSLARNRQELEQACRKAWGYDDKLIVEKFIQGRELTAGILNNQALPLVEVRPKNAFFDFDAKYANGTTEYIVPAPLDPARTKRIQETALKAHQVLNCACFSRVDFILGNDGQPYVLEVNTIPGFTATSLLPKAAAQAGINFQQLVSKIVEYTYGKKKETSSSASRY